MRAEIVEGVDGCCTVNCILTRLFNRIDVFFVEFFCLESHCVKSCSTRAKLSSFFFQKFENGGAVSVLQ